MNGRPDNEDKLITTVVVRLNAVTTGLALGSLCGLGLFLATVWLLLKGGPRPGPHLALLAQYLPGYSVSLGGSLLGFLYALGFGFVSGFLLAFIYNRLVK